MYPIPFRNLKEDQKYSKYQWIQVDAVRNLDDPRPETFRPRSFPPHIVTQEIIQPDGNAWIERRSIVLQRVYTNLSDLIGEAKNRQIGTSLATFKPFHILDFIIETTAATWDPTKLEAIRQGNLFQSNDEMIELAEKIPFKFSYKIEDDSGKQSTMMIEDWEIGELYRNCLKRHEGDEGMACSDVRKKYFDDFAKTKDVYLFLGTTKAFHFRAPNPFIIIGVFYPKPITQDNLFG